uniref:I78 family peptidase inhibitor n=1 Tax=Candidatus Electronema sp. TaxID=2698783 RepID=UPI00405731E7
MGNCKEKKQHSDCCGKELNPEQCKGLIGRLLRVYTTGDMLTMDYNANRVNIEMNEDRIIVSITFG